MLMPLRRSSGNPSSAIMSLEFDRSAIMARFSSPAESSKSMLTPIRGQHTIALERAARSDAPSSASARSGQSDLVGRSDRFRRGARRRSNERSSGKDPIRASAPWVALDSAGQLGRPQTPWRQEKNNILRLEKKK